MSETKKAAISLLVAALVFVLTAFSSAQAWGEVDDITVNQTTEETQEETAMETLAETDSEGLVEEKAIMQKIAGK